jgi:hypothetical protein
LLLIGFDVGTILVLMALLRARGKDPALAVLYAWSPLAALEVGGSGHGDPAGVFLLLLACWMLQAGWRRMSVAVAALSGAAKFPGFLALPSMARRTGVRPMWPGVLVVAGAYSIYAAGAGWGVLGSFFVYVDRWRFNDSVFAALEWMVRTSPLPEIASALATWLGWIPAGATWDTSIGMHLVHPLGLAKLLAAGIFVGFCVRILRRGWGDPVREIAAILGAALILSPTLHPWYLLWIAPFLCLHPRLSWIYLCFAAPLLAYPMAALKSAESDPLVWLRWVEFAPFFGLLILESARRRLWERT